MLRFLISLCCLVAGAAPLRAMRADTDAASDPPRVGLVLSGGGSRGLAHVGVLKALEEQRIPIHAIAGTSMGAVVGGLYASGMSAEEIEKLIRSVNWQEAFRDRPPREELGFRRKQDDRNFLVRYSLGITERGFTLPRGLV
jgi:NTE family protein